MANPLWRCLLFASTAGCVVAQDPHPDHAALHRAADQAPPAPSVGAPGRSQLGAQTGPLRLLDVGLGLMAAVGTSTERDAVLADLKGGGHDPRRRGFTLQQADLSLASAIDPWLVGEAHIVTLLEPDSGETVVELEEAYLKTQQLPAGLELKAGTFLTEFGRINPMHPHDWDWQDQPVVNTRLFGADGMRGPGARLSWRPRCDGHHEVFVGAHNANGETMTSFLANDEVYDERPIGGRLFRQRDVRAANDLVYTLRAATSLDLAAGTTLDLGASAAFGPNPTGSDADTTIWGVDFVLQWGAPEKGHGAPTVTLQGEFLVREFDAAQQTDAADPLNPVTVPRGALRDQGAYVQALWGFTPHWAAGVRVDWASGSGDGYDAASQAIVARRVDPYRADRLRVSPLLAWQSSDSLRVRLQYDYDDSDHLADPVHSVWLGCDVLLGTHPPHSH